jgi:tRNA(His) 5'-end guanylyltransferase
VKPTLKDRIDGLITITNQRLLPKVPVVIVINGRGFNNATALIDKPFSPKLAKALCAAMGALVQEIGGAVFGYQFDDEIVIVSRNDQTLDTQPWCNNDTQKLASIASSITTLHFNAETVENMASATFYSYAFVVPNITEAINLLVSKQQQAFQSSVYHACHYELLKRNRNENEIADLLKNTSNSDKVALLAQECGIDYDNAYPPVFRRGAACYRAPKTVEYQGVSSTKMGWKLDASLPVFTQATGFLLDIVGKST